MSQILEIAIMVLIAWIIIPDPLEFLDVILLPILGLFVAAYLSGA